MAIRSSEDAYVDQLFGAAPDFGAVLLAAKAPRAFVDLNRCASELDSSVIDGVISPVGNPRVASGLGVIPRVVSDGRVIRSGKMPKAEAEARLVRFYHPYHGALKDILDTTRAAFGKVMLVDCHSMPSAAVNGSAGMFGKMPEVVIGDRFGASCERDLVEAVEAALADEGFRVGRNTPFAGAFISREYGRPGMGQNVVQIEIDRSLYMDEVKIVPHSGFAEMQERLGRVVREICEIGRWPMQVAAE